jgi:hypothetical protein
MLLKSTPSRKAAQGAIEGFLKVDYPYEKMEPRRVRPLLEQHGTTIVKLKPGAIWRIAMADLERRERNKERGIGEYERFAFHRDHVAGANTANDIIRAAIADIERGQNSDKADTRLIYSDVELLKSALR